MVLLHQYLYTEAVIASTVFNIRAKWHRLTFIGHYRRKRSSSIMRCHITVKCLTVFWNFNTEGKAVPNANSLDLSLAGVQDTDARSWRLWSSSDGNHVRVSAKWMLSQIGNTVSSNMICWLLALSSRHSYLCFYATLKNTAKSMSSNKTYINAIVKSYLLHKNGLVILLLS